MPGAGAAQKRRGRRRGAPHVFTGRALRQDNKYAPALLNCVPIFFNSCKQSHLKFGTQRMRLAMAMPVASHPCSAGRGEGGRSGPAEHELPHAHKPPRAAPARPSPVPPLLRRLPRQARGCAAGPHLHARPRKLPPGLGGRPAVSQGLWRPLVRLHHLSEVVRRKIHAIYLGLQCQVGLA